ncbi:MAG: YidC/Oxa1 family membrane protein insertase [Candidatus Giovannonibacteria bacterium]|nr:MAG: YidC/Oxa1 family membrane protein insertase [Candidatus Giovannonibacteria bacterium]
MSLLKTLFHEIFYLPILNALVFLTSVLPGHDLGLAVILLTALIRALMFPMTHKMLHTQNAMKRIEPEVKKIYEEKKNREEQAKALMELYKKHGINPLSGFFMLLIQLPLLIAMYRVFWRGIPFNASEVYGLLSASGPINLIFLGLIPLTEASVGMAALAAISQFWQAKLAMPPKVFSAKDKNDPPDRQAGMGRAMQWQMLYVFPIIIFVISFKLPAAVSLYWTAMNVFAIVHEAVVRRSASRRSGGASYGGK